MKIFWLEQSEADVPAEDEWLSSNETRCLSGMRFLKRRSDWRLGRWTAKQALAACFGFVDDPEALKLLEVHSAASGAPVALFRDTPVPGSISITHRGGVAACALTLSPTVVGCDLEIIEARSSAFLTDYFTAEERALVCRVPASDQAFVVTLLWSAKESALKAVRQGLRADTRSVIVRLLPITYPTWAALEVHGPAGSLFHGWYSKSGNLVRTVVAAARSSPPITIESRSNHCLQPEPVP